MIQSIAQTETACFSKCILNQSRALNKSQAHKQTIIPTRTLTKVRPLTSSGRESVATVISNSSSDTIKFNERHSSSETLKYYEPGDDTQSEAVRQSHRTGSICDEHFLGHDSNHNTWLAGHSAKRQLYRSHSEAGAREEAGHVDTTWQRCSYCGAQQPDHHDACPIVADFRQSQDPVSDNMVSTIWIKYNRMCLNNRPPSHGLINPIH